MNVGIAKTIETFRAAAEANWKTPGRRGCVVHLESPAAADVVVAADMHGQRLNFYRLLKIAELESHPRRHLVLQEVCHGGPCYPNDSGACMSHLLLEDVAELKARYPDRVHFLLSNHELAELIDLPITKGKRMLNLLFRFGVETQYGAAADEIRELAMAFIASSPLAIRLENGVFISHSAPEHVEEEGFDGTVFDRELQAADLTPGGAAFRVVWGRDFREKNAAAFARLVNASALVHGHEPCSDGACAPNSLQLILDSSHANGCCLMLDMEQSRPTVATLLDSVRRLSSPR